MDPHIWEDGDSVFMVAPVAPITPQSQEVEEFAFAEQLRKMAPNENLLWLQGQYVEADNANANGQMWTAGELAIKALTPNFMPVTVMHDPATAVGLIADTKLLVPDRDSVPRSRIDTSLAIWEHRFPDVAVEVLANHERGELMQSMECRSPWYECADCGKRFLKMQRDREKRDWCAHLNENGRRILGDVVFTGTGLIFGTRGARGANDKAHLEVFQEEVAEYHQKAHRDTGRRKTKTRRKRTSMDPIEISREEYAELQKRPSQDELAAEKKRADDAEEAKEAAEAKLEKAEQERDKAVEEKEAAEAKVEEAEEAKRKSELASDRLGKLGKDFKAKLGEKTRERLNEQAKSMSDEEWQARLDELSELLDVKPDAGGTGPSEEEKAEEFTEDEVASTGAGRSGAENGNGSADAKRVGVVGKLFDKTAGKTPAGKDD